LSHSWKSEPFLLSIQHNFYKKWLRYYLDFCAKYRLPDSSSKSLTQFLTKLREKKQTDEQIKQADHAVSVYLDMTRPSKTAPASAPAISAPSAAEQAPPRSRPLSMASGMPSPALAVSDPSSSDVQTAWKQAITDMAVVIKTRHYSPSEVTLFLSELPSIFPFPANHHKGGIGDVRAEHA